MSRFHVTWEMNLQEMPKTPEERVKLWITLLEMVKADLKAGFSKDWGVDAGGYKGYAIWEGVNEAELYLNLVKYFPYVIFKTRPALTVYQAEDAIKKAVAAMKK